MSKSQVTRYEELTRVKMAMAFPLRWVNSYALRGEEGWTIVDPGPRSAANEAAWNEALDELGIRPREIASIVLTHHHPDHYGLAGWLQQRSGAQVWMSKAASEAAWRNWGGGPGFEGADAGKGFTKASIALYRRHGMAPERLGQLPEHLSGFLEQVEPQPEVSVIEAGLPIRFGGRLWQPVETGGHAEGHLSFYEEETGLILCGDAVLPRISPNISYGPGGDAHPLRSYLDGLRKLGALNAQKAFPGHRDPFENFEGRTRQLLEHHEQRLDRMEELLRGEPRSAYEVCVSLFGDSLGIHQLRFALSETIAHLVELEDRGRVRGEETNERIAFRIATPD
ncbi:MBL fold metallo-hydrolase [Saccharibacillus alkalitolerans]|uniref:MBL fold metallo-hydrolase n=1 Tax=Saccharibacillus alkalitolerans TaxID=2705290 RepID=A0ABX0F9D1_9BACL|nr:MBL fold metallo-hydrolase [Saccharibacillus alkalitolerans]NGZ77005.1 MBL fold metallo-hydrolase [Saccharibacillus alkalitolerans]